ncbi:MAG: DUF433 domain-containing protein [Planctomycetes bacterium]|nr:DUF433 domain-containing protein [Planctomycetota bacterium]
MKQALTKSPKFKPAKHQLRREMIGDRLYEYFPLGKYVVVAPGVCGGRPTFKYTRLEVSLVLSLISPGETIDQVVKAYALSKLSPAAVREAIQLADKALAQSVKGIEPALV